ncbi:Uncharacterised protein [uncultured archaeon]|nr:Uncharacterised protein [uncultured archaeon]
MSMGLKERFLKVYADVPLSLRSEIIVVLDGEPVSWNAAFLEVSSDSKNSEKILKKLEEMAII